MRRRQRSKAEWVEICRDFEASGQTAAVFARRRNVHRGSLFSWRSKLRREGLLGGKPTGFVEVVSEVPAAGPRVIVQFGKISVEFLEGVPSASWLADLAARC